MAVASQQMTRVVGPRLSDENRDANFKEVVWNIYIITLPYIGDRVKWVHFLPFSQFNSPKPEDRNLETRDEITLIWSVEYLREK